MKKILLSALVVCCLKLSYCQSGGLDPSFGIRGIVKTDMGSTFQYNSSARQVLIRPDGTIYIILNTATAVSKRFSDGSIDSSYGLNGNSFIVPVTAAGAALQPDGKIVIAGGLDNGTFGIARINTNGITDSAFGNNGLKVITLNPAAIAVQSDGKIVVAGTDVSNNYFAVARYNTDGSADNSFNGNGQQVTDFGGVAQSANAVAIQPDGKIVAAGGEETDAGNVFAIVRFKINGTPDSTFGTNGKQTTKIGALNDIGYSLALQSDGKIILAGLTTDGANSRFALVRYTTNGSLDNSFNGNGKQVANLVSNMTDGNSVAIQSNGKIVVAGYALDGDFNDFAIARFNTTGIPDSTFNGDGILTTDMNNSDDYARSVSIQADDKIVVAGYAYMGTQSSFAVARYSANGILDPTFNHDGKLEQENKQGSTGFDATAIQADGKIIAAGRSWNGVDYDFAITRFNRNGTPDSSFSGDGRQLTDFGGTDEAFSIVIQPDGKIVAAGNSDSKFATARYNADGSPDSTFNGIGKLITSVGFEDNCKSVALQSDGKIVIAGSTYNDSYYDSAYFAIIRLNSNGTPDNSFGGNGIQVTGFNASPSFGTSVAIQNNGKIVVGGRSYFNNQDYFSIARYNDNGSLDTTFSHDGKQASVFGADSYFGQSIAIQNDGKIVIAGYSQTNDGNSSSFAIARYLSNGDLDNTFSNDGFQSTYLGNDFNFGISLAINNINGRIAVGGTNDNFAVVLYKTDGSPDSSFGIAGIQTNKIGIGNSRIQSLAFFENKLYAAGAGQFPGTLGIVARYFFSEGGPLAVNVIDLKAALQNKTTLLQWQTTGLQDLSGYYIERSAGGSAFLPIGYISSAGNGGLDNNYSAIDREPVKGINFYRLKMMGKNGSYTYSKIVSVNLNYGTFTLQVYPNPVQNMLFINADAENEKATFQIIDAQGRKLDEVKVALNGNTSFSINVNKLPRGMYTLQLLTNTKRETRKFIKE